MAELAGMDKIKRLSIVFGWIRDQLQGRPHIMEGIMEDTTMEESYRLLRELTGIGPFLGYQIAVDLSYWSETQFGEDDFVVMGPGAKHGIDWLFPSEKDQRKGMNEAECCIWMRDRQFEFWDDYDIHYQSLFDDRKVPYLTLMALENLCCEFQKYMKAHTKDGRPRNRYKGVEGAARLKQYRENEPWNTTEFSVYDKPQNLRVYKELKNVTDSISGT
jgi:nuclear transport factor 2 (NTF2) superfamily protein